ncbi:MAG: FAD-binding protein [Reinekea sp.]
MNDEYDADVLIVGYGAAGANAAIAAHDAGASVMIIEKMSTGGGNSAVCAGGMLVPKTIDEGIEYYRQLASGTVDDDVIVAFAEAMVGIPDLLRCLDIEYIAGADAIPHFKTLLNHPLTQIHINPTGESGFKLLDDRVKERGIRILTDTQVTRLVQNLANGEILGLIADHQNKPINLKARKGVILCCGGYASNPAMLANFNIPGATDYLFSWGSPGNTGDGIQLACQAGAALWHTASLEWGKLCAREPSRQYGTAIGYGLGRTSRPGSYLIVNQAGKRFMAEDSNLSHRKALPELLRYDHDNARYQNLPAFLIFDQAFMNKGPIAPTAATIRHHRNGCVGYALVKNIYDWSHDNQAEFTQGWIKRAETIHELADSIGASTQALEQTIEQYNRACAEQRDTLFNRSEQNMIPLGSPPYFSVELGLALVNTQGGPKRNGRCQVLDHHDSVVPRLYTAGELGSFFGFLYQPGSNYPEAWASGQIAGRMVADEEPQRVTSLT